MVNIIICIIYYINLIKTLGPRDCCHAIMPTKPRAFCCFPVPRPRVPPDLFSPLPPPHTHIPTHTHQQPSRDETRAPICQSTHTSLTWACKVLLHGIGVPACCSGVTDLHSQTETELRLTLNFPGSGISSMHGAGSCY